MKLAVSRTTAALAAFATVGVSGMFLGAAPASAATFACGATGTLVSPGICEQTVTTGTTTFTPPADLTKLEVLLVGAGGAGLDPTPPNSEGYAAAGGGGEVKIVNFSTMTDPLTVTVATPGTTGGVSDGVTNTTVANGSDAFGGNGNTAQGGVSGNGNAGGVGLSGSAYTAGGGGAASAATGANGGAGVVVSAIAPSGSLFSNDTNCYGGGGATGIDQVQGIPGCGGGGPADITGTVLAAAVANSGGGGGGLTVTQSPELRAGADGLAVIRWSAAPVIVTFDVNGHGTAPASQSVVAGTAAVAPTAPTATGYTFEGWFTDPQLTTAADFSAAVTEPTTYYASWTAILAVTGGAPSLSVLPIGIATLLAGAGLFAFGSRRKRNVA